MTELAEFVLELPVRRGYPQDVIGLTDVVESPIYSTAVGLLKYAVKNRAENEVKASNEAKSGNKFVSRMKALLGEVF